jgi:NADPH:quinone reductase and related Zn-dependent oxidoreductases
MKAAVCLGYGAPEQVKVMEVPIPKVGKTDVLIKVMASAVNSGDVRLRGLKVNPAMRIAIRLVLGITKPRKPVLGIALAGEIVEVGEAVHMFKVGDQVYAMMGMRFGGHGQFATLSEKSCIGLKPANANYEEAAVLPFGGTTAIHFLNKAGIKSGQEVMIYGASGAVGSSAVQVATYLGAKVTAVCSGRNGAKMLELGASEIIDYKMTDIKNTGIKTLTKKFDIIFDAVGKVKKTEIEHLIKEGGKFISVAGYGTASARKEYLNLLAKMFEEEMLDAVIDRTYLLDDIVEAHRYVDQGVKTGNIAITIPHNA